MLKTIAWTAEMSVGVEEIDNQHKQFIQIMSDFYDAFNKGKVKEELAAILERLIKYADFHFKTEEKYFDKFNYEFADEHKAKHRDLENKAFIFKDRFEEEGIAIVEEFMEFLTDWLVDHLETADQKYVKCFHDHGLF